MLDGYPVALVLNLHQAARRNRRQLTLDLAVGVSLGIRDALSSQGGLLQSWLQLESEPGEPVRPRRRQQEPVDLASGGLPIVKGTRKEHA